MILRSFLKRLKFLYKIISIYLFQNNEIKSESIYKSDKAYIEFLLDNHEKSLDRYTLRYLQLCLKLLDILLGKESITKWVYHDSITELRHFECDVYVNIKNVYKYFNIGYDYNDYLLSDFEDFRDGDIFRNELRYRKALRLYLRIKENFLLLF